MIRIADLKQVLHLLLNDTTFETWNARFVKHIYITNEQTIFFLFFWFAKARKHLGSFKSRINKPYGKYLYAHINGSTGLVRIYGKTPNCASTFPRDGTVVGMSTISAHKFSQAYLLVKVWKRWVHPSLWAPIWVRWSREKIFRSTFHWLGSTTHYQFLNYLRIQMDIKILILVFRYFCTKYTNYVTHTYTVNTNYIITFLLYIIRVTSTTQICFYVYAMCGRYNAM